uniref:Uncharacterized protein n=1 Tax=Anguilla anguilla TaxID=7936 RepID=A0A0E9PBZ4_ANGAN
MPLATVLGYPAKTKAFQKLAVQCSQMSPQDYY